MGEYEFLYLLAFVLVLWGCPHKLPQSALNSRNLSVSSGGWKSKSRCRRGWFLLRALRENPFHASLLALVASGIPRRKLAVSQFCTCLCPNVPLYKDTSHTGLRPTLMTISELDHLQRHYSQIKSHLQVRLLGGYNWTQQQH